MSFEKKLEELGIKIDPLEQMDNGKFLMGVQTGNLIFTAGQTPIWGDESIKGEIGSGLSIEQGQHAARLCTYNNLRAIKTLAGSLDRVERIVKVLGMVNTAKDFDDTPAVINGCSEFLREVFGEKGHHARSAVGMTLPFGFAVEIEMVVQVKA